MNGWKNYETWNVSLWIQNDEPLYRLALASAGFQSFMNQLIEWGCTETQDGVKWGDADYCDTLWVIHTNDKVRPPFGQTVYYG